MASIMIEEDSLFAYSRPDWATAVLDLTRHPVPRAESRDHIADPTTGQN